MVPTFHGGSLALVGLALMARHNCHLIQTAKKMKARGADIVAFMLDEL